jgi:hypothetical protein
MDENSFDAEKASDFAGMLATGSSETGETKEVRVS